MIEIIFFLSLLLVNLSNSVWVRDEFLFCDKIELIKNEKEFCEYAFLPFGINRCVDKLEKLANQEDEYDILNHEKRVVIYSKNKQLFNSSCQKVSDFYIIDIPDCVKGIYGNFSLNNIFENGFIRDNGIIVKDTDINDRYCLTNFELTGLNKKVLITKSSNFIEIFYRDNYLQYFLSDIFEIKYLVCVIFLTLLIIMNYFGYNNQRLMIFIRKILNYKSNKDDDKKDDVLENVVVDDQSTNGTNFS